MHYYECEKKRTEIIQKFPLLNIKSIHKIRAGRKDVYSFEIKMRSPDNRVLTLRSRTREDAERWIGGLSIQISCWKDGREGIPSSKKNRKHSEKYVEV